MTDATQRALDAELVPIHASYDVYELVSKHLSAFDLLYYQSITHVIVRENELVPIEDPNMPEALIPANISQEQYENVVFGYIAAGNYIKIARRLIDDKIITDPEQLKKLHQLGMLVYTDWCATGEKLFHKNYSHARLLNSQIGKRLHEEMLLGNSFTRELNTLKQVYHVLTVMQILMRSIMAIDIEPESVYNRDHVVLPVPWAHNIVKILLRLVVIFDLPDQAWKPIVDKFHQIEIYRLAYDDPECYWLTSRCLYELKWLDKPSIGYNEDRHIKFATHFFLGSSSYAEVESDQELVELFREITYTGHACLASSADLDVCE